MSFAGFLTRMLSEDFLTFLLYALFFMAVLGQVVALFIWLRYDTESRWQVAKGTITRSAIGGIIEYRNNRYDKDPAGYVRYYHTISYSYSVDEILYTSNVIRYWRKKRMFRTEVEARSAQSRFRAGNSINVYYDPLHPEVCVLERLDTTWIFIHSLGGFFWGILGILLWLYSRGLL